MNNFCSKHSLSTQDKLCATHLFMDGGKVMIENDTQTKLFLKRYVTLVSNDISVCLVERSNATLMRFFLDVDIKDFVFNIDAFIAYEKNVLKNSDYIICTRQKGSRILGVHVVYHNITYTSTDEAKELCKLFHGFSGIDASVYSTGLRVVGSVKPGQTVSRDTIYLPHVRVNNAGITRLSETITNQVMKDTFIRLSHENRVNDKTQTTKLSTIITSTIDIPETILISEQYENCITSIQYFKDDLYILNTESRYCTNIKKEHASASVYFVVNVRMQIMNQKCFCRCANKTCKTYKSQSVPITKATRNMLIWSSFIL